MMKTERIYLGLLLLLAVLFAGCSEETLGSDTGPETGGGEEQEVSLQLKVFDEKGGVKAHGTRAMEGEEGTINGNVLVFVYNDKNQLEYNEALSPNDDDAVTFKIKTGKKFLYVFANPIAGKTIEAKPDRSDFERQVIEVAINNDLPDLAGTSFLMGNLWGPEEISVAKPVKTGDNEFTVDIGRLAAKVKLKKVVGDNTTYSNMRGKFIKPQYTIGSIPKKTFLVGQFLIPQGGSLVLPPAAKHSVVESAVHNQPATESDKTTQNPVFTNYTTFIPVDPGGDPDKTNPYYVVENTTALDATDNDNQYYGNTTYIRLKTVYVPDASEVYKADLSGLYDKPINQEGQTFYSCIYQNRRYLTIERPNHPDIDDDNIYEYEDGINHHFFPIMDNNQEDDLTIYSVLRNHYYEVDVTGIKDLGVGKKIEKEDPWIPIKKTVEVLVTVNVIDWSTISQSTEI